MMVVTWEWFLSHLPPALLELIEADAILRSRSGRISSPFIYRFPLVRVVLVSIVVVIGRVSLIVVPNRLPLIRSRSWTALVGLTSAAGSAIQSVLNRLLCFNSNFNLTSLVVRSVRSLTAAPKKKPSFPGVDRCPNMSELRDRHPCRFH